MGFISRGRGIIVHRKDCHNLKNIKDFGKRIVNVNWSISKTKSNIYSFFIQIQKDSNPYMDMLNEVQKMKGVILKWELDKSTLNNQLINGYVTLEFEKNKNILTILSALKKIKNIVFVDKRL